MGAGAADWEGGGGGGAVWHPTTSRGIHQNRRMGAVYPMPHTARGVENFCFPLVRVRVFAADCLVLNLNAHASGAVWTNESCEPV
jgi:hypothetical protein